MNGWRCFGWMALLSAIAAAPASAAERRYGPGVSDTEIRLGNTMPYSGPVSALGTVGRTLQAYWTRVNESGGIGGRQVRFISLDDGFSPPKTVEQVRKLVEHDEVAAIVASLGTAPNTAIHKYLNARRVPQLFIASAAAKWNDPRNYPWTVSASWGPNFVSEGRIHAKYLLQAHPRARVAVLFQNDDSGKELLRGLREGLGQRAADVIVAEASFELSDPTIDSQLVSLRGSGADTLMIYSVTPKACTQAIRKAHDLEWRPQRVLSSACVEPKAVLEPAGYDRARGLVSLLAAKQINDDTRSDADVAEYLAFMRRYYPEGKPEQLYNVYAYLIGNMTELVLRRCGDDLTRENILKQATTLKDVGLPMLLPGIRLSTSPTDYATIQDAYMVRFDGERWVPFGGMVRGD